MAIDSAQLAERILTAGAGAAAFAAGSRGDDPRLTRVPSGVSLQGLTPDQFFKLNEVLAGRTAERRDVQRLGQGEEQLAQSAALLPSQQALNQAQVIELLRRPEELEARLAADLNIGQQRISAQVADRAAATEAATRLEDFRQTGRAGLAEDKELVDIEAARIKREDAATQARLEREGRLTLAEKRGTEARATATAQRISLKDKQKLDAVVKGLTAVDKLIQGSLTNAGLGSLSPFGNLVFDKAPQAASGIAGILSEYLDETAEGLTRPFQVHVVPSSLVTEGDGFYIVEIEDAAGSRFIGATPEADLYLEAQKPPLKERKNTEWEV